MGAALVRAEREGKLVLLDVGAVWCPPCNLLAAEVLDNPDHAEVLAPFVLAEIDADDPSSFDVKDRYAVGGYPSLLVLRPDGTEIDRMVGYWQESDTVAWLRRATNALPFGELPPADSMTPDDAAKLAVRMALSLDEDAVTPYLARAAASDSIELPLARFLIEPTADDGKILAERDAPGWDWVFAGLDAAKKSPALADALRTVARRRLAAGASSFDACQSFQILAELARGGHGRPELYLAAAQALEAGFSGEPDRDRGHYGELADLYEHAGATERARTDPRRRRCALPRRVHVPLPARAAPARSRARDGSGRIGAGGLRSLVRGQPAARREDAGACAPSGRARRRRGRNRRQGARRSPPARGEPAGADVPVPRCADGHARRHHEDAGTFSFVALSPSRHARLRPTSAS